MASTSLASVRRAAARATNAAATRDAAIREAAKGHTVRAIAEAAGLSPARIHQIIHGR